MELRIAVSLTSSTFEQIVRDGLYAIEQGAQILEFRIDYLHTIPDLQQLAFLFPHYEKILTVRSRDHAGGDEQAGFKGTEEQRISLLQEGIDRGFNYVDVELDCAHLLHRKSSLTKIIASYHNFKETPSFDCLRSIYANLVGTGADILKVATKANTWEDNLTIFTLIRHARSENKKIIGICMGERGIMTREYGPLLGSYLTFAALDSARASAPGQLNIDELCARWQRLGVLQMTTSDN